jgi:hypothetical protein
VPVTAKLSKLFYDRLGEEIADELVNWFNAVDATYRADLRDLNELNFARFDTKLEQRIAEVRSELRDQRAELIKWMFLFWAGTVLPLAGLIVVVLQRL